MMGLFRSGHDDIGAAIKNAGTVKRSPDVKSLLRDMQQPELLAGFGDPIEPQLFRGMMPVMTALVRAGAFAASPL
jgi:hypothetical protein